MSLFLFTGFQIFLFFLCFFIRKPHNMPVKILLLWLGYDTTWGHKYPARLNPFCSKYRKPSLNSPVTNTFLTGMEHRCVRRGKVDNTVPALTPLHLKLCILFPKSHSKKSNSVSPLFNIFLIKYRHMKNKWLFFLSILEIDPAVPSFLNKV